MNKSNENQREYKQCYSLEYLEAFQKKLDEGYTEVAQGSGSWVGDLKILTLLALYHPNSNVISTVQIPKQRCEGKTLASNVFFEQDFSSEGEFDEYCEDHKVDLNDDKTSLVKLLSK